MMQRTWSARGPLDAARAGSADRTRDTLRGPLEAKPSARTHARGPLDAECSMHRAFGLMQRAASSILVRMG